ncbi:hypothetical protein F5B20DRAFT_575540 [Whalleya microplaca]|nr:hypothetical protein F5B20DRAFT_575540 [Whalleya microplaca]
MAKTMPYLNSDDAIRGAFNIMDQDGDNSISEGDLRHFLESVGEKPSNKEVKEMVQYGDQDGSGCIDYPDIVHLLQS